LTGLLAGLGQRDAAFPLPHGRGDEARSGGSRPDPRDAPSGGIRACDIYVPNLRVETLKAQTRDIR
jgi:error-prone DNA polymerase